MGMEQSEMTSAGVYVSQELLVMGSSQVSWEHVYFHSHRWSSLSTECAAGSDLLCGKGNICSLDL